MPSVPSKCRSSKKVRLYDAPSCYGVIRPVCPAAHGRRDLRTESIVDVLGNTYPLSSTVSTLYLSSLLPYYSCFYALRFSRVNRRLLACLVASGVGINNAEVQSGVGPRDRTPRKTARRRHCPQSDRTHRGPDSPGPFHRLLRTCC